METNQKKIQIQENGKEMGKKGTMEKSEIRKVPVTSEAEESLFRMLKSVNEGFSGGKVSKAELFSWLILYFEKHGFEEAIPEIRRVYFDRVAYLASVLNELRRAERDGTAGPDLEALLAPVSGRK